MGNEFDIKLFFNLPIRIRYKIYKFLNKPSTKQDQQDHTDQYQPLNIIALKTPAISDLFLQPLLSSTDSTNNENRITPTKLFHYKSFLRKLQLYNDEFEIYFENYPNFVISWINYMIWLKYDCIILDYFRLYKYDQLWDLNCYFIKNTTPKTEFSSRSKSMYTMCYFVKTQNKIPLIYYTFEEYTKLIGGGDIQADLDNGMRIRYVLRSDHNSANINHRANRIKRETMDDNNYSNLYKYITDIVVSFKVFNDTILLNNNCNIKDQYEAAFFTHLLANNGTNDNLKTLQVTNIGDNDPNDTNISAIVNELGYNLLWFEWRRHFKELILQFNRNPPKPTLEFLNLIFWDNLRKLSLEHLEFLDLNKVGLLGHMKEEIEIENNDDFGQEDETDEEEKKEDYAQSKCNKNKFDSNSSCGINARRTSTRRGTWESSQYTHYYDIKIKDIKHLLWWDQKDLFWEYSNFRNNEKDKTKQQENSLTLGLKIWDIGYWDSISSLVLENIEKLEIPVYGSCTLFSPPVAAYTTGKKKRKIEDITTYPAKTKTNIKQEFEEYQDLYIPKGILENGGFKMDNLSKINNPHIKITPI
ncbi:Ctf13p SCDLUD_004079 [Saccharomycodes ludwigii]|uniref:Ctf13p n=1 Tax=Saccharomycodes ludwigii TaxID=36035 RepID=UPI001E8BF4BE|nr:hypothetical protein SCDLUD_004079 [Saccharomycodes ludwigii]KAH3899788.1 hypothetical protein SCDLUD_004079 [Saccharomycodes ludwigii]